MGGHQLGGLLAIEPTLLHALPTATRARPRAGIAFLACHPIGAEGDECMVGPYRQKLLKLGAFGSLLRAALTSVLDNECDEIIQQAAAIGVMYLSTMVGTLGGGSKDRGPAFEGRGGVGWGKGRWGEVR